MDNKEKSKSWFNVLNNPKEIYGDKPPHDIAEIALAEWIKDHPTRTGAVAFCISEKGLEHLHMVLEDSNGARFSTLKNTYPKAHLEPTKGSKEQAEAYIHKKGKWEEKGEQIIYIAQHGEIKGNQGSRRDLDIIEEYIEQGMTPSKIMSLQLGFRRYEKMIKDAYFSKRSSETPFKREVNVVWHVGDTGSGKSHLASQMAEEYGEDYFCFVTDFEKGGFDHYNGECVLFIDELRGGDIKYNTLLSILDVYKVRIHCRYTNCLALWNEVHITSPLPPDIMYQHIPKAKGELDNIWQLRRRIKTIIYHWKTENGEYKKFELPMSEYIDYETLKNTALGTDGFTPLAEDVESPFEQLELL